MMKLCLFVLTECLPDCICILHAENMTSNKKVMTVTYESFYVSTTSHESQVFGYFLNPPLTICNVLATL